jgi:hypothetical protein
VPDTSYWLIKVLIAAPGFIVGWMSFRAYRRRRADRSATPVPADRWWRVLFLSGAVSLAALLLVLGLDVIGVPRPILLGLLGVVFIGGLGVLVAAFAIGWTAV